MTAIGTRHLTLLGLAEAGKSSFLHAADEQLLRPRSGQVLVAEGIATDRKYLEEGKAKFRSGERLGRTRRTSVEAPVELPFHDTSTGRKGCLYLPDVNGESFTDQWAGRIWTDAFEQALNRSSGLLLFVRADVASTNAELLMGIRSVASEGSRTPYDPRKASPQVQLVDTLQCIQLNSKHRWPLRVAVLVSAWDVVPRDTPAFLDPAGFLATDWALLSQYLRSNDSHFASRVYGVSALGGSLGATAAGTSAREAHDRCFIVYDGQEDRDLTAPLQWLMSEE